MRNEKMSEDQKIEKRKAYKRRYYKEHPEKYAAWRRNSILRAAARIMAEEIAQGGSAGADPGEGEQEQSAQQDQRQGRDDQSAGDAPRAT